MERTEILEQLKALKEQRAQHVTDIEVIDAHLFEIKAAVSGKPARVKREKAPPAGEKRGRKGKETITGKPTLGATAETREA